MLRFVTLFIIISIFSFEPSFADKTKRQEIQLKSKTVKRSLILDKIKVDSLAVRTGVDPAKPANQNKENDENELHVVQRTLASSMTAAAMSDVPSTDSLQTGSERVPLADITNVSPDILAAMMPLPEAFTAPATKPAKMEAEVAPVTPTKDKTPQHNQLLHTPVSAKTARVATPSSSKYTPTTREKKRWSPVRRRIVIKLYTDGSTVKKRAKSPEVRKIIKEAQITKKFKPIRFENRTIYQADFLFDPAAKVLSKLGVWETNLQRMERGIAPVGNKGIANKNTAFTQDEKKEIRKRQKEYSLEIHHALQVDTGKEEDPLFEMTKAAHMGRNARFILAFTAARKLKIIASSLEKDQANALCSPSQFIASNVLHFRTGKSLIDRNEFATFRVAYWIHRASEIKKALNVAL